VEWIDDLLTLAPEVCAQIVSKVDENTRNQADFRVSGFATETPVNQGFQG
jgi:hypothetical protein